MFWSTVASAASSFMPPQATSVASQVDHIYAFLLITSLISFILLIGGMIVFVLKYKRTSETQKSAYITHNHTAEFLWSFIPFLIFMFVFGWGWYVYNQMRTFPDGALEVHVFAKKWDWRFVYKNGKEATSSVGSDNEMVPATMVVPVGRPVKLIMSSTKMAPGGTDPNDRPVLHSFFVPAFRVKQDLVPGRYTALTFTADKEGTYHVFCAEYCGGGHSGMRALIKVVPVEEFEKWLSSEGSGALSLVDKGRDLYAAKACIGCHSLNGTPGVGPTWKGLWGIKGHETDKGKFDVDENYMREAILNSNAKIVKGYAGGIMPVFAGQLSDDEVNALIEFIKSVK